MATVPDKSGNGFLPPDQSIPVKQPLYVDDVGSAAYADVQDFASSAQGSLADTALQPADLAAIITPWVAYTPSFQGFGTPTDVSARSRRIGSNLEVMIQFTSGTSTADQGRVGIGFDGTDGNVDVASWVDSSSQLLGKFHNTLTSSFSGGLVSMAGADYLCFVNQNNGLSLRDGDAVANSGTIMSLMASIPIEGW